MSAIKGAWVNNHLYYIKIWREMQWQQNMKLKSF